jgi:peptide/nickel transport system permease protein
MSKSRSESGAQTATISGVDVMRGVGQSRARGFWADAWSRVLKHNRARLALVWMGTVGFFAVFAPLLANSNPIWMKTIQPDGSETVQWPLFDSLTPPDLLLVAGVLLGVPWLLWPCKRPTRAERARVLLIAGLVAGFATVVGSGLIGILKSSDRSESTRAWIMDGSGLWVVSLGVTLFFAAIGALMRTARSRMVRWVPLALVAAFTATLLATRSGAGLVNYDQFIFAAPGTKIDAIYAPIPWSPDFSRTDLYSKEPFTKVKELSNSALPQTQLADRQFILGTDAVGKDVLSQMLWACRLSISIGLVSTGISLMIGITLGALAGYYGGKFDLLLYRLVEIFMAIPVLFLLIVAAGVLPRNIYVMMALIGCVGWTGSARFTRAEFMKLRNQDFVQAAKALGLPLRSILFKHMLPNGVTPVLVDASFAVAAAILAEATLSYLGLGPDGQPSWGKLLSSATGETGAFIWWLAIFPGLAIFFTVLAYNMLGEELRDAIDPKLRKAAH